MTMPEVLLTTGVLLLVSALFFSTMLPLVQREKWFREHQTLTTRALVARARLQEALERVQLIEEEEQSPAPAQATLLLEFYRPNVVQTDSFGSLAQIDRREILTYDKSVRHQLRLSSEGRLVETEAEESYQRLVWNLGEQAAAQAQPSASRDLVVFTFSGTVEAEAGRSVPWEKSFTIRLR